MKTIKQTILNLAVLSGLALVGYTALDGIYQAGVKQGLEKAELISQREKRILTHTGYTHLVDRDYDGKFDMLRQVECGPESSDTLYVREGYGPAQSVDSVVRVVGDAFFRKYNAETE